MFELPGSTPGGDAPALGTTRVPLRHEAGGRVAAARRGAGEAGLNAAQTARFTSVTDASIPLA